MTRLPSIGCRARRLAAALLAASLSALAGCSPDTAEQPPAPAAPAADFVVRSGGIDPVLIEGDPDGLAVPLSLERDATVAGGSPVRLTLEGRTAPDVEGVTHEFDVATLDGDGDVARLTLRLDIGNAPILPHTRRFTIVASDGVRTTRTGLDVAVEPVDAPDVYLLIGQSNMVGSSLDGTRDAAPGGPDVSDPRVRQLNVAPNDGVETFTTASDFTSPEVNIVGTPLVVAEDPLHEPRGTDDDGKSSQYIGLGLTFGKRAAEESTAGVVLVPAAWSGSAFCDNENDPLGHWNPEPTSSPVLGNTLLFDRALLRVNAALAESGGILRGILWHQGESDANLPCATLYGENLQGLARALRTRIDPDVRGPALRGPDAPIPFVVGTMSRGVDENGDYSEYNAAKQLIDDVHRDVADPSGAHPIPHSAVSVHDDLVPAEGYPCGFGDCIHFGARALREMGVRYHEALLRARPSAAGT